MPELLGTATFPSGDLLLIDFGLLDLWSGEQPPEFPDGYAPPKVVELANSAVDYEIVGPRAREAAQRIDLAVVKGRYAFDVPRTGPSIPELVAGLGLDATARPTERMPHFTRVQRLLADQPDGVEVPFHGIWSVAVRGVPAGPLRVLGEPGDDMWDSVWVECAPGVPVRSVEAGFVLVDKARLLVADPAALNHWTDEPAGGLFDLEFWGRDEQEIAARLGAPEGNLWRDLTLDEARPLCTRLKEWRGGKLMFNFDLRPHNDHYRLMEPMRVSGTDSATIEVGGAEMTGLYTAGDGGFPVYRDLAADGTLLRVRIDFS